MNKQFARSLQWFRQSMMNNGRKPMTSLYETIKEFEIRSDASTKIVTAVSAKSAGNRVYFRVATLREHVLRDGTVRRSPWLGLRELDLKAQLEQRALEFIASETARLKMPGMTFSA